MDLAEKESTDSGSGSPVETESPEPLLTTGSAVVPRALPVPVVMNMAVGVTENSTLEAKAAIPEVGRGGGQVVGSGDLVMVTAGTGSASGSAGKKKRGRPRKYDSEGNLRIPFVASGSGSPKPGFTLTSPNSSSHSHWQYSSSSSTKRGRGRPSGSGNWQLLASLGELFVTTACDDFTPHVVNVNTGEDVTGKIINFSQKGLRGVCVLAANGTISNVTIRQPGSSGGLLTYEGRFEILSLTGSYTISGDGIVKSRTGGLSVSLAGPDGRVIGGGVAGSLLAASPIQMVVGSFVPNSYKTSKRRHNPEPKIRTPANVAPDVVNQAKPVSQAAPQSHMFPTATSHFLAEANGEADNSTSSKDNTNSTSSDIADYNGSGLTTDMRETPDINVSVPFD